MRIISLLLVMLLLPSYMVAANQLAPRISGVKEDIVEFDEKDLNFYFNQAMLQAYGFEYENSLKSFEQTILIDEKCALCHFGKAYAEFMLDRGEDFKSSITIAFNLRNKKKDKEKRIIEVFYNFSKNMDEKKFLRDFYLVAKYFPRELWIQNIYVSILSKNLPNELYSIGENPSAEFSHLHDNIMAILALDENNIGGIHHILNLAQYSKFPQDYTKYADFLLKNDYVLYHPYKLAGSLYLRIGRFISSAQAFDKAERQYQETKAQFEAQGFSPKPTRQYLDLHRNMIFNAYLNGQSAKAELVFQSLKSNIAANDNSILAQEYLSLEILNKLYFGQLKNADSLAIDEENKYLNAIKLYATAILNIRTNKFDIAEITAKKIEEINETLNIQDLKIASELINLLITTAKRADQASIQIIDNLDNLLENNPNYLLSYWHLPVRIAMAESYRYLELYELAEEIFEKSLRAFPDNPYGLYGMMKLSNRFRDEKKMLDYRERFQKSWSSADITKPVSIVN